MLVDELHGHTLGLPLPAPPSTVARQDELDRLGTELWNLSTRLRRDDWESKGNTKDHVTAGKRALCLLRVFSFLLLDTASIQAIKAKERKSCIRLAKVALKAARICIESGDLDSATKVLERASDYQDALDKSAHHDGEEEAEIGRQLRVEYFAVRISLVSKT